MSTWQVAHRETGEVVYAYTAETPTEWPEYPFAAYNHVLQIPEPVAPVVRIMTKREYLGRFTQAERVAIRAAASANPVLDDYLKLMELAQEINLDDPDTVAAVTLLEQVGLLAQGRGVEILA